MGNVLITGCSSGFGRASAIALARRGENVYATMRNPEDGAGLLVAATEEGLALSVLRLDVTDTTSVNEVVGQVLEAGPIDALVNNAGRGLRGPLSTLSDREMIDLFDVNVFGVVRMARAVIPSMLVRGCGTIVNISSIAGVVGVPYEAGYSASKHAVEAISESLRWELGERGVRVAVIEPGAYATEFFGSAPETAAFAPEHPERPNFQRISEAVQRTMLANLQDPVEVADAVCTAILAPDDRLHRLVGQDAHAIDAIRREHTYEEYEQHISTMFGLDTPTVSVDAR